MTLVPYAGSTAIQGLDQGCRRDAVPAPKGWSILALKFTHSKHRKNYNVRILKKILRRGILNSYNPMFLKVITSLGVQPESSGAWEYIVLTLNAS